MGVSGPQKVRSWLAPGRWVLHSRASRSPALSADGNTAVGRRFLGQLGRRGGVGLDPQRECLDQQSSKLVGTGAVGKANQGFSVALSDDGNTVVVGGSHDNSDAGAAWVWTRSGSVWTQQVSKLVGTGAVGAAYQGWSVALSADGNTAVVGGFCTTRTPGRRGSAPAAGVFGPNKVPSWSVPERWALQTRAPGRALCRWQHRRRRWSPDNSLAGAAWVYTRSGSVWTQQGSKLVGTGAGGNHNRASRSRSRVTAALPSLAVSPTTGCRGGVGLDPRRKCLDPARFEAGRHRSGGQSTTGLLGRALGQRQHRRRRRFRGQALTPGRRGSDAGTATPSAYTVTYNGNGNTGGTVPVDGTAYAAAPPSPSRATPARW